jgi:hypothetical protein
MPAAQSSPPADTTQNVDSSEAGAILAGHLFDDLSDNHGIVVLLVAGAVDQRYSAAGGLAAAGRVTPHFRICGEANLAA